MELSGEFDLAIGARDARVRNLFPFGHIDPPLFILKKTPNNDSSLLSVFRTITTGQTEPYNWTWSEPFARSVNCIITTFCSGVNTLCTK